jgi:hypothetical protein
MPRDFLCLTELVEGDTPPVGESGRRLHGVAAHYHAHLHLKIENKSHHVRKTRIIVFRIRIRKFLSLPNPDPSIYKQKNSDDFNSSVTSQL